MEEDSGTDTTVVSLALDGTIQFYGPDIVNNPNFAAIVADRQAQILNSINSTKGM